MLAYFPTITFTYFALNRINNQRPRKDHTDHHHDHVFGGLKKEENNKNNVFPQTAKSRTMTGHDDPTFMGGKSTFSNLSLLPRFQWPIIDPSYFPCLWWTDERTDGGRRLKAKVKEKDNKSRSARNGFKRQYFGTFAWSYSYKQHFRLYYSCFWGENSILRRLMLSF